MSQGGQPSITEAYLRGEQQEILRESREFDTAIKRSQLEDLMRERVASKRRVSQGYIQAYEKFTDPDTDTSELGKYLTIGGAEDAPGWIEARQKAIQRKDERDQDIAGVEEVLRTKRLFGEMDAGPEQPVLRASLIAGLQAKATTRRAAENQAAISERAATTAKAAQARLDEQKRANDLRNEIANRTLDLRKGLAGDALREQQRRTDAMIKRLELGELGFEDLVTLFGDMQSGKDFPSAEEKSLAVLAAGDAWDEIIGQGASPSEAARRAILKYDIKPGGKGAGDVIEKFKEQGAAPAAAAPSVQAPSEDEEITRALAKLNLPDTPENRERIRKRIQARKAP